MKYKLIFAAFFLLVGIAAASVFLISNSGANHEPVLLDTPPPSVEPSAEPSAEPTVPSEPPIPSETPSPSPPPITAEPVNIKIPALELDCEIKPTVYDKHNKTMDVYPDARIISWYTNSPIPGNEGGCILAGHNKWKGRDGALLNLDTLSIGDSLTVTYDDDTSLEFFLESVFVYALQTAPSSEIMSTDGETRITVITCKEPFNRLWGTSENRIVAVFKPAEGFVVPDPPVTPIPTGTPNPRFK